MEVLQIFGSWDPEIDSWFTNHEPLILSLTMMTQLLSLRSRNKLYITFIFLFSRYYLHIMLLIWSKKTGIAFNDSFSFT